jgi:Family of unknown function (DUF5872)
VNNLTTAYFEILKSEKQVDGTTLVYGKATDDSLDIDQQICDAAWLDRAMPEWFKTGGNIREQHSHIAAGVAKEYELKKDGHYILAHVVDPISVKKVETGVLRGFSIGIKSPRVVRDEKAANGRIIDGQIVEVSLVDRPANPNCQLVLAKSVEGESTLVKSEDLIEITKKTNYEGMLRGGGGSEPADKDLYNRVKAEAKKKFDVYPSAVANAWVVREYKKRGGKYRAKSKKSLQLEDTEMEFDMTTARELVEMSKSFASADTLKFDADLYNTARQALAQLIQVEAGEMGEGSNEEYSLSHLLEAVHHLFAWYQGEQAEGEVMENEETMEMSAEKAGDKDCMCKCSECQIGKGCDSGECKCMTAMAAGLGEQNSGPETEANLTGATIEAPKSAEGEEAPAEETLVDAELPTEEAPAVTEVSEEAPVVSTDEVEAIVEKAVKSALESYKSEVAVKVTALEGELALAKSQAVAGGPRRTAKPINLAEVNDLMTKAAGYMAKANATTDPVLAKGFKQLANEFYAKASEADITK